MVCPRCISAVSDTFKVQKLSPVEVNLGHVVLDEIDLSEVVEYELRKGLQEAGFVWLDRKKEQLVSGIKSAIVELVSADTLLEHNLSTYLEKKLLQNYGSQTATFKEVEGITIEQYHILQRVERAKELITYGEYNLSEIAELMHYSGVGHLSAQFKKVTGLTPSAFKANLKALDRVNLDQIGTNS